MNRTIRTFANCGTACLLACGPKPSSDLDTSVPGSYAISLKAARLFANRTAHGTLVLTDTAIPTRSQYFLLGHHFNGCIELTGDMTLLVPPEAFGVQPSDSFNALVSWRRDSSSMLRLSLYQGVDYGYSVDFVVSSPELSGSGRYYGITAREAPNKSTWHGTRLGPPNTRVCAPALRQDSLWAAKSGH